MPEQPSTLALCRLCRRPLVSAAVKCPSCGARQSWSDRARGIEPPRGRRVWRITAGAAIVALLIVGALVWFSVMREIKRPILSDDGVVSGAGRPPAAECAQLAADLSGRAPTDQRVSPEIRDRIRQCFDRR